MRLEPYSKTPGLQPSIDVPRLERATTIGAVEIALAEKALSRLLPIALEVARLA